jgi:hypothetical protein
MTLPAAAKLLAETNSPRYSVFFLIHAATGPVRAWLGIGNYELPADDVDLTGGTYLGIGLVGEMPALRQLVGGLAERVEFVLNGADERTFRLSDDQAEEVRGAAVNVGIIFFDEHWQSPDPVAWLWDGECDVPAVERDGQGTQISRRVTMSVGSAFVDRTRPKFAFYTDTDQKRRSPDDTFCSRVASYGVDSTIVWPAS